MEPAPMEASNEPLNRLPSDFKNRVAGLAPIDGLQIIRQAFPEFEKFYTPRLETYDKVYITDDETVYQRATEKLFLFRVLKPLYWMFRWVFDGNSFSPIWHSVLRVDDIVKKEDPIIIKDTLVVNCKSIESFERLIPHICGDFSRLMIRGEINLDQLHRLLLTKVRKVIVTANIQLQPHEYDEAVRLIMGHVRGYRYNFKLLSTPLLFTAVKAAVRRTLHLAIINENDPDGCNVIYWTRDWFTFGLFLVRVHNYATFMAKTFCKSSSKASPSSKPSEHGKSPPSPVPKPDDNFFVWYLFFATVGFFFPLAVRIQAANMTKPRDWDC
uniref:NR LBD domain-containing protein n=1 Tax=Panagrellus redivivus TaxID=6233 RepID=A0A7E4ZRD2_PANRE